MIHHRLPMINTTKKNGFILISISGLIICISIITASLHPMLKTMKQIHHENQQYSQTQLMAEGGYAFIPKKADDIDTIFEITVPVATILPLLGNIPPIYRSNSHTLYLVRDRTSIYSIAKSTSNDSISVVSKKIEDSFEKKDISH